MFSSVLLIELIFHRIFSSFTEVSTINATLIVLMVHFSLFTSKMNNDWCGLCWVSCRYIMFELRLLLVLKYVIPKWNFFLNKNFLVHAFPQKFLNYILYIYCDDFKPCLFNFLFSLNSHNTKMLCTICLSMAKVCNYQCKFFFCFIIIRLFFWFYFLLVMNDEHVYLASHKNSER